MMPMDTIVYITKFQEANATTSETCHKGHIKIMLKN